MAYSRDEAIYHFGGTSGERGEIDSLWLSRPCRFEGRMKRLACAFSIGIWAESGGEVDTDGSIREFVLFGTRPSWSGTPSRPGGLLKLRKCVVLKTRSWHLLICTVALCYKIYCLKIEIHAKQLVTMPLPFHFYFRGNSAQTWNDTFQNRAKSKPKQHAFGQPKRHALSNNTCQDSHPLRPS